MHTVSDLSAVLREAAPGKLFEIRAQSGDLLFEGTPREAEHLRAHGYVEGVENRRGFKYLRLKVKPRVAFALLRRMLCASGRTVSEASQLTAKYNVPGGGIVYSHFRKRVAAYSPANRAEFI